MSAWSNIRGSCRFNFSPIDKNNKLISKSQVKVIPCWYNKDALEVNVYSLANAKKKVKKLMKKIFPEGENNCIEYSLVQSTSCQSSSNSIFGKGEESITAVAEEIRTKKYKEDMEFTWMNEYPSIDININDNVRYAENEDLVRAMIIFLETINNSDYANPHEGIYKIWGNGNFCYTVDICWNWYTIKIYPNKYDDETKRCLNNKALGSIMVDRNFDWNKNKYKITITHSGTGDKFIQEFKDCLPKEGYIDDKD